MHYKAKFYLKFFLSLTIFFTLITACGNSDSTTPKYKIILEGTSKMRFTGFYKTISPNGKIMSQTVEGILPMEYSVEDCKSLVCSFQKEAEMGELRMKIQDEKGADLFDKSTSMSYGSVELTTEF